MFWVFMFVNRNFFVSFDFVIGFIFCLVKCKNFIMFEKDFVFNKVFQWMFFMFNMDNFGYDIFVVYVGRWVWNFIIFLLVDSKFNILWMLVMLIFDEGLYSRNNQVYVVLLGSVVLMNKRGIMNGMVYGYYNVLKMVEVNWGLGNLGQKDVGVNVFF